MNTKEILLTQLKTRLDRVPTTYQQWSHQKAVGYKQWVIKARKVANGGKATETQLTSLINEYENF